MLLGLRLTETALGAIKGIFGRKEKVYSGPMVNAVMVNFSGYVAKESQKGTPIEAIRDQTEKWILQMEQAGLGLNSGSASIGHSNGIPKVIAVTQLGFLTDEELRTAMPRITKITGFMKENNIPGQITTFPVPAASAPESAPVSIL